MAPPSSSVNRRNKKKRKNYVSGFNASAVDGAADADIHFSSDGRRRTTRLTNQAPLKRRRRESPDGDTLDGDLEDWVPIQDGDVDSQVVEEVVASQDAATKRKTFASDDPLKQWRALMPKFLDELMRREGLGHRFNAPKCAVCGFSSERIFRCEQCGEFLMCEDCVRDRHWQSPLHRVKEWSGEFWVNCAVFSTHASSSGTALGMVYQLGHHGFDCVLPETLRRTMVVLHVNGIFKIDVVFCGCSESLRHRHMHLSQLMDNAWYPATAINPQTCATYEVLDLFRTLQVVGNVNAHDFVRTLERLTDATFTEDIPDRYTAFARMAREYTFTTKLKRAGRAHEDDGIRKTDPGGLAVRCWACPQPGRNMAPGWETASEEEAGKHALMLALDANFRMKNRIRPKERNDPPLGPGLGFFVAPGPYKEHIKNYVTEDDVSTCIAFQALIAKNTRMTTGLRVSGVGGCVCARHGLLRPLGMGDLQKGERYSNMDWIFLCAVNGCAVLRLVVSYDIACQWKQHLLARGQAIGESPTIITSLANYRVQFGLPVWHAEAHEEKCRAANSLMHAVGVGRTDGESIERLWALLNPSSYSTKEMGEGNRQDTIEDKLDYLNFSKNVGQAGTLKRKLLIAIAERDKQKDEFAILDKTIDPVLRRDWQRQVDLWNVDQSRPNPYLLDEGQLGPTEAQVAADLKKAELEELRAGRTRLTEGKVTMTGFVQAGLQLGDLQERIRTEVKGTSTLTAERASQIDELRVALLKKLKAFRNLQAVYMPSALELSAEEEEARDADEQPPKAEDIKLWLPSDLSPEEQKWACRQSTLHTEAKLREAQCGTALVKLRSLLFAKSHVISHRNANIANRYRGSLRALRVLKGQDHAPHLQELRDEDVRVHGDDDTDAAARAALGRGGTSARRLRNEPRAQLTPVSWIWSASGREGDSQPLHDAVRVQWCKALARRQRWEEEVELIREEMKRVLRDLKATEEEWKERATGRTDADHALAHALSSYANRQAALHRRIRDGFFQEWSTSVAEVVRELEAERLGGGAAGTDADA
ncbi:hypothetical protein C8F01DRAFT_1263635 [Mycena amicta]|nr:hypothetical protein C8F01DRAFT_1263635 [Mycena amicta]